MPLTHASPDNPFTRMPTLAGDTSELALGHAAPLFPADFVHRRTLVERLRTARRAMLAVVVAPAGYGKSALIAEWAESDDRRFAWLAVDLADTSDAAARRVTDLVQSLGDDGEPWVIVIDDAHRLRPEVLQRTVTELWKRLPANSVVAVATRAEPTLPLGRLRAHRALIEIRMRDLAMTPAEAAVLLRRAGIDLDFADVQALVHRTEGWPAALYLAALSLADRTTAPEAESFRGDDHLISEYLRDEVLDALPRSSQTFLRRASVLSELAPDVCDAVLGQRRSALKLRRLAEVSGLLEPVDAAHERFRWHPLLRESMDAELRRREPELVPTLHAAACTWHADHGDLGSAIEHAVAAGDASRSGELLWNELASYVTEGRIGQVQEWLARFTPGEITKSPSLTMCAAAVALASGDAEMARRWTRELDARPAPAVLIEAMTGDGGVGQLQSAAELAGESLPPNSPWRAACLWLEGVGAHLAGDRKLATARLEQSSDLAGRTFAPIAVLAMTQRAMIAMEDDRWELASELTDETTTALITCRPPAPVDALAFAAAAAARSHQGRADEAKQDLQRVAATLAELDDTPAWFGAQTRLLLAHASLYLADVSSARGLLAQASRHARRAGSAPTFERWFERAWSHLDTVAEASLAGPSGLTIAELRVLRFLPSCRPFREIADQLGVSANTVKTQAHAIYRKLGASSRSEAVRLAREAGLLGQ